VSQPDPSAASSSGRGVGHAAAALGHSGDTEPRPDATEQLQAYKWERRRVKLLRWFYCRTCGNPLAWREAVSRPYLGGMCDACFRTDGR
jgi:hypothetical protein